MSDSLTDTLLQALLLVGVLVPLFLLVVARNRRGGSMHARRLRTRRERERFADDWAQEERGETLPGDPDHDEAAGANTESAVSELGAEDRQEGTTPERDETDAPDEKRDGDDALDFVGRMRVLHARLRHGEITKREFELLSRRLAQQAWDDKGRETRDD